jgi:hypothetical protein
MVALVLVCAGIWPVMAEKMRSKVEKSAEELNGEKY